MTVWADGFTGTIGGGTLEYEALAAARALLTRTDLLPWHREMHSYPLGPALGQCCGGMVRLVFETGLTCRHLPTNFMSEYCFYVSQVLKVESSKGWEAA